MIQEYRKEMSKVHAGEDLIRRTKLAALQESGSYALRKKRQQRLFPILGAAAACILLLFLPGALQQAGSRNQTPQRMGHKTEQTREISQIPQPTICFGRKRTRQERYISRSRNRDTCLRHRQKMIRSF